MFTLLSIPIIFQLVVASELLYKDKTNAVIEFNYSLFKASVESDQSDRTWVVIFYAHWCGHCVSFAPEFMDLAESLIHPGHLEFGAIDCASNDMAQYDSVDICREYDVRSYPTIRMFRYGKSQRDLPRKIEELKAEILGIDPLQALPVSPLPYQESSHPVIGVRFTNSGSKEVTYDASLAMYEILRREVFRGSDAVLTEAKCSHLSRLLDICSNAGIEDYMRGGCQSVMGVLNHGQSLSRARWQTLIAHNFPTVGEPQYRSCSGFSCAMWKLLHVMTVSPELDSSAKSDIRFVIDHYFSCEECRKNFLEHFDKCDFGGCDSTDPMSVALWLWRLHNGVNERLGHAQWPAKYTSEEEVYELLRQTYGNMRVGDEGFSWVALSPFYFLTGGGLVALGLVVSLVRNTERIQTSFSRISSQVNKKYYEPVV